MRIDFLRNFFKSSSENSKNIAKERLQFILIHDRIKLSPGEMESLKNELLEVLTKYVEVDDSQIKMEVSRTEGMTALVANFPIKRSG
ncbi:MAG: cell division topological specificity factor MinE [Halanaerobiaceae bacterium]|nr:cell division topological specificity factor MinE [Halanaerobiaceae bacterium]